MILGIAVHFGTNLIDTGIVEATTSPIGLMIELVVSMRDMEIEVLTLGLRRADLVEDMEVDIFMMLSKGTVHFPVRDTITVTTNTVMVITAMVMVAIIIGTASSKSSPGWKAIGALTQQVIVRTRRFLMNCLMKI